MMRFKVEERPILIVPGHSLEGALGSQLLFAMVLFISLPKAASMLWADDAGMMLARLAELKSQRGLKRTCSTKDGNDLLRGTPGAGPGALLCAWFVGPWR